MLARLVTLFCMVPRNQDFTLPQLDGHFAVPVAAVPRNQAFVLPQLYGAFQEEIRETAIGRFKALGGIASEGFSGEAAVKREARVPRETAEARNALVYPPAYMNAAIQGEELRPDGSYQPYPGEQCRNCLPNGQPC
jgi:hypothetical protein